MTQDPSLPEVPAAAPGGQTNPTPQAIDAAKDRLQADPEALPIATVEDLLGVPSDLVEDVVNVPEWGFAVRIRSLTAAQSAKVRAIGVDQSGNKPKIDFAALEKAQFQLGVIEPKLKPADVNALHQKSGPGFAHVLKALDEISGTDPKKVKETLEAFQESGRDGTDPES